MGAYLSSPVCDKDTIEGSNNRLAFGASSMQGWRMSQEDAHNAILNFDDKTSLFAVYDGHGGAEIAIYCSRYLPAFLKKLDSYKEGRLNDALIECFLKFDSLLLESNVKKILQKLANDENVETDQPHDVVVPLNPDEENNHNDELNAEEAQLLKKEAEVPIEELLKRYKDQEKKFHSPNISKRTINNNDETTENLQKLKEIRDSDDNADADQLKSDEENVPTDDGIDQKTAETLDSTEAKPSSSEPKSTSRRPRKPVSTDTTSPSSTTIKSNSLIRHLLSNNTDQLEEEDDDDDEDDFEIDASDEDTSGDEAEDHETDDENAEDEEGEETEEEEDEGEDKPLKPNKAAQIQKLMRKSIMAILNRRAKKKKHGDDEDDVKENQNEENESDDNDDEEDADEENDIDDEDETDLGMLDMNNDPGSSSGCTAVVTLLRDRQLLVANAGDSRCVVCHGGRAIEMSIDHKPEDPPERSRIEKAGYKVTLDGRVSGGLNLSRAIGDHAYKKTSSLPAEEQAITALPDIRTLTLEDQDEFMIIACDGIWNFMSSQDAVDFVRNRLEKKTTSQICEELFMHCLAPNTSGDGTGCDNMTAIIVKFNFHQEISQSKTYTSPTSINNKRPLSPDHISTNETIDNSNSKKLKVLAENGTSELASPTKPAGAFSVISNEQMSS